jgi:hypothetical protein
MALVAWPCYLSYFVFPDMATPSVNQRLVPDLRMSLAGGFVPVFFQVPSASLCHLAFISGAQHLILPPMWRLPAVLQAHPHIPAHLPH